VDHHRAGGQPPAARTDHVDLYQMHRPDPTTDIDETLDTLSDLVRAGKVERSVAPPSRQSRSSRPSGCPSGAATYGSAPSSRPTRSSPGGLRPPCCRPRSATAWASYLGPLSAGWLSGATRRASTSNPAAAPPSSARSSTRRPRATPPSWRPSALWPRWPRGRGLPAAPGGGIRPLPSGPHLGDHRAPHRRAPRRPPGGADVVLDGATLDRIDEIVPPGTDLNPADSYYVAPPSRRHPPSAVIRDCARACDMAPDSGYR